MATDLPPPTDDRVFVATRRQVSCTVSDEVVILHLDDGAYYGLNQVGTRVWELLQEPRRLDEIVMAVVSEFDVSRSACEADIRGLLKELGERGLLEEPGPEVS
ncbi:MAG TPA: PqqD family protein [Polyangiaceae bacterium]|nr:PqqD family protein [Polyangiaceae bacterium]